MSVRQILLPWDSQPQEVESELDTEYAAGATVWSAGNPEILTHRLSELGVTHVNTEHGVGVVGRYATWTDTSNALTGISSTDVSMVTSGITILVWAQPTAEASIRVPIAQKPTGIFVEQFALGFNAGTGYYASESGSINLLTRNSTNSTRNVRATGQIDGDLHCWVVAQSTSGGSIHRDGVLQALATDTSLTGASIGGGTPTLTIGNAYNLGTSTRFSYPLYLVAFWPYLLPADVRALLSREPLRLFAPRSIWVPVSVGAGGGTASITPADGIATTSTFAGTSTAVAALTAAAGAATTSTITASAIAAATMTAATGAATTSTLTGSAATAASMTAAAGAATASTLTASSSAVAAIIAAAGAATASTLTASASAEATITAAAGAATASTMTGAATAVAAMTSAAGTATTSTLTGSGLTPGLAGMSPAAGVATTSTMAGKATAAASLTPAAGAATAGTLAGASTAAAAMTPATGSATGSTMTSGSSAISAASMVPAAGAASASTLAASAVAASVCIAAAGAAAAQTVAASAMARAAISAAAGVATCRTLVDANAVDTNSAWWTYTIAPDNLTFAIPADDLSYAVGADQLAY